MAALDAPAPVARSGPDWAGSLKDATYAALIAFGLLFLLVGLKTDQTLNNEMVLRARPGLLAGLVAAVFVLRLLISAYAWRRDGNAARSREKAARGDGKVVAPGGSWAERLERSFGPVLLAVAIVWPIVGGLMSEALVGVRYWVDLGTLILTYVMLGWGLNIVVGLAGLLDLGYVAFYAVGAYAYALLSTSPPVVAFMAATFGPTFWPYWAFWFCLPFAGLLAALWGAMLGFPVLRLRGDYLAIVTLAFGEIIRLVLINWVPVTGGYAGIAGIPRPSFFGLPFTPAEGGFAARFGLPFDPMHRIFFLYYLILALALLTYFVTLRLRRLPVGRAWEALREDEIACRSLGMNTVNTKLTAFSIGAGFAGLAGAFFATRQAFISPESFTFIESAVILAIVVLGGMGSSIGVVIASVALIGGMEMLRNLEFLRAVFGTDFDPVQYRMLIFGLAMVLIMIWKPRGLISTRSPSVFLKVRRAVSGSLVKEGHG